ncbi:MAG: NUDIX hydrolase [Pseudomonadota bacterium]
MKFCSICGSAVDLRVPPGDDRERAVCAACETIHYVNPKIVVGSVCTYDDRVLLCRRAIEPRRGFWTIPAGYLELDESAEEGAAREALEEACARIEIEDLIAVYSVRRARQIQLLFRARLPQPNFGVGDESLEVELVAWDAIPWTDLAFPTVHLVLERARDLRHTAGPLVPVRQSVPD